MSDTDPPTPTAGTSGPRPAARTDPPRSLGGTLATVALLLGVLFAASASPALLAGLLVGLAVGGGAALVASYRRQTTEPTQICVPKANVCVQL